VVGQKGPYQFFAHHEQEQHRAYGIGCRAGTAQAAAVVRLQALFESPVQCNQVAAECQGAQQGHEFIGHQQHNDRQKAGIQRIGTQAALQHAVVNGHAHFSHCLALHHHGLGHGIGRASNGCHATAYQRLAIDIEQGQCGDFGPGSEQGIEMRLHATQL